jgi:gliding motility-associated-like protein
MRKILLLVLFSLAAFLAEATHIRAGEITYRWLTGYNYEITVVLYVKTSSNIDGATIENVSWGDGKVESLARTSEVVYADKNTTKRIYVRQHTFPGPGKYNISLTDYNRNGGIQNIANSVEAAFYIETELIANPFSTVGGNAINNSPILLNPPLDDACLFAIFEHNPAAHDIDGDSLTYRLIASRGDNGQPLVYQFPNQVNPGSNNVINIDPLTGDLIWDAPQKQGEYNIAILIEEFRNGTKVGSVLRDMQIDVTTCSNKPPVIVAIMDTCIEAGKLLRDTVTASDPNTGDAVKLTALGGPFTLANPAIFKADPPANPVNGYFEWQTSCENVRKKPWQVNIKATDNNSKPLVDYESFFITVVGPAPRNPSAVPQQDAILVGWQPSVCSNVTGYKIYRRYGPYGFKPGPCETGVPEYTGYRQVGEVDGHNANTFVDTNLAFSTEFCYMIVAIFPDGAESYASEEVCADARRDVPVMTKVSVGKTDLVQGHDTVEWVYPSELDTALVFRGPYYYQLFRDTGITPAVTPIYTTPVSPVLYLTDTIYIDTSINTTLHPHTYRVELYNNNKKVGSSANASSVFLSITTNDQVNHLEWKYQVPWLNDTAEVFRLNDLTGLFEKIGASAPFVTEFYDRNVENGKQYCYYVVTSGYYQNPTIKSRLRNYSQQVCATPADKMPPCELEAEFTATPSCDLVNVTLSWDTTTQQCNADLKSYNIYYSPVQNGPLEKIKVIARGAGNSYVFNNEGSIAGCFAFSVTDSSDNESARTATKCIENCPSYYELPNVFSPNEDGVNDLFHPFPYRFVSGVDAKIYNRWGKLLFETTNPDINWDGKAGGKPVEDGVYFYVVIVNKTTLQGDVKQELNGTVTIFTAIKDKGK